MATRALPALAPLWLVAALAGAVACSRTPAPAASQRLNVVFILADDLGWSDTTLYGTTTLYETPNLERLAHEGMTFTRAYAASPVCSPTRASILTGLHPARIGLTAASGHRPEALLREEVRKRAPASSPALALKSATRLGTDYETLGEALHEAGYATGHFGKWHLGPPPWSPLERGFDVDLPHWNGPGPAGRYLAPWRYPGFRPRTPHEHIEDRMGDEAVAFLAAHRDTPFFLNYWQFSVHAPFDAKPLLVDHYRRKIDPSATQRSPTYAAMVQTLDENVGKILDALDRFGLADRTLVVFVSDNGGNTYDRVDGTAATSNAPLRGGKGTLYEGGIRVPLIVRWPGVVVPGTRSDEPVQSTDFYPTLLEALGLEAKPGQHFDGVSLVPALEGGHLDRDAIFTYLPHLSNVPDGLPPSVSVNQGSWKLIRVFFGGGGGRHAYQLYDLDRDPGERRNLAREQPQRVAELDRRIDRFLSETGAVLPVPNPAYRGAVPAR